MVSYFPSHKKISISIRLRWRGKRRSRASQRGQGAVLGRVPGRRPRAPKRPSLGGPPRAPPALRKRMDGMFCTFSLRSSRGKLHLRLYSIFPQFSHFESFCDVAFFPLS